MPRTLKLLPLVCALAVSLCATHAAARQSPTTDDDFERGKQLLAQDDAKGARKAFERAVKLSPNSADAHAGLAFSLLKLGKLRDAERAARRALAADPRHGEAHYVLGYVRFEEEKYAEALAEVEAALRARPDFAAAAYFAADALLNIYIDESARQNKKYPHVREAPEAERKAAQALREQTLAPLKARMRELAGRLESLAAAQPNAPDAAHWRDQAEAMRIYGRPLGDPSPSDVISSDQLTMRALITFKPEPGFTEEARRNNVTGVIRLRVILGADGKVRNIVPMKRLPDGLTDRAIEAARQIRFTPGTLDGRPVSQSVILEYNFNIY